MRRQDGEPQRALLDDSAPAPEHVIGFLFDGTNPNVLYDLAARGEAPNVARLMAMGTTLGHGAMSSLPTVTLANHTAILCGTYPGHHGILHNAWWDRATQAQVITNSPATWIDAMATLDPGIESLYAAVQRHFPGSFTASVNEPCDTDADYSTFGVMRAGGTLERPPGPDELPHSSQMFVRPVKDYRWSSRTDHTSVTQFLDVWSGEAGNPRPRFCWVNFTLTDAAFHEGGPYSEIAAASVRDTDGRIGEIIDAVEASGVIDRTAFFLVADHGMEETNPAVRGNWSAALDDIGIPYRDEAYGFIYLHPEVGALG
jgi:predicted AlkP superfamily pyrophosphatase or phosphodiesterase